jgi:hypothetical protein
MNKNKMSNSASMFLGLVIGMLIAGLMVVLVGLLARADENKMPIVAAVMHIEPTDYKYTKMNIDFVINDKEIKFQYECSFRTEKAHIITALPVGAQIEFGSEIFNLGFLCDYLEDELDQRMMDFLRS